MDFSKLSVEELKEIKKSTMIKSTLISLLLLSAGFAITFLTDFNEVTTIVGLACMLGSIVNTFYTAFVKARPIEVELGKRARGDWRKNVAGAVPQDCNTTVTVTGSNIRDAANHGFGLKKYTTYYVWKEGESLKLFPTAAASTNAAELLKTIPLSSILFYEPDGERYHETKISGGGGRRVSVTGAVLGKAVGGTAGAVLLGNKGAKPVQSRDVVHDNRHVALRLTGGMSINFAFHDYTVLKMVIPEKDISAVNKKQTDTVKSVTASAADEIAKYKKLLDDGAITKEEFEAKKKKLLNL